jgi:hypothetical protein
MLVAFLALLNGTSPSTCIMKALSAFLVFAGFGLILRYVLIDSLDQSEIRQKADSAERADTPRDSGLDVIVPGTSVADLLGSHGANAASSSDLFETEEQRAA